MKVERGSHIKRIPYIRIGAEDLKKSVAFYQDALSLESIDKKIVKLEEV